MIPIPPTIPEALAALADAAEKHHVVAVLYVMQPDANAQAQIGAVGDPHMVAAGCNRMLQHINETMPPRNPMVAEATRKAIRGLN